MALRFLVTAVWGALCLCSPLRAQQGAYPASLQSFQISSHGSLINAFVYVAAGVGPHPVVVLLHGFPGNERNLDLAQEIRRAGWDVLYFDYRGSWGSAGNFSYTHAIEDTTAAVDSLRSPQMARMFRLDPSRIVLIGHSMGGFMAVQAAAADPRIFGIGLISAADLGGRIPQPLSREGEQAEIKALSATFEREGIYAFTGCTAESLAHDLLANAERWSFAAKLSSLTTRPVLIISSNDAYTRGNQAFAAALRNAGNNRLEVLHLPSDHVYSDQRPALAAAVLGWLATLRTPAIPR